MTNHKGPAWRYHATQGAKLFVTEDELIAAEAQGWADSPAVAAVVEALPAIEADLAGGPQPDDGVEAALEAAEKAVEQGEDGAIEEALEDAEDAIEKVQAVVRRRKR